MPLNISWDIRIYLKNFVNSIQLKKVTDSECTRMHTHTHVFSLSYEKAKKEKSWLIDLCLDTHPQKKMEPQLHWSLQMSSICCSSGSLGRFGREKRAESAPWTWLCGGSDSERLGQNHRRQLSRESTEPNQVHLNSRQHCARWGFYCHWIFVCGKVML